MDDVKVVVYSIIGIIVSGIFFGLAIEEHSIKKQLMQVSNCRSTYVCEKGVMDYQEGQCVCSKIFPSLKKD